MAENSWEIADYILQDPTDTWIYNWLAKVGSRIISQKYISLMVTYIYCG